MFTLLFQLLIESDPAVTRKTLGWQLLTETGMLQLFLIPTTHLCQCLQPALVHHQSILMLGMNLDHSGSYVGLPRAIAGMIVLQKEITLTLPIFPACTAYSVGSTSHISYIISNLGMFAVYAP